MCEDPWWQFVRFEPVLKRILVPTDGSTGSQVAQQVAALIAKAFKSKVTVIHAISSELGSLDYQYSWLTTGGVEDPLGSAYRSSEPPPAELIKVYRKIEDSSYRKGEQILVEAVAFFKQEGVIADEKLVEHAEPAEAITKQAHEGSYGLIVMGQRKDVGEEPHLGSTAERVTRHSDTPVLIVSSAREIQRMLIPFDGSRNAEKALQYAAYLAKNIGAKMTLLYVHHPELIALRPEKAKQVENRILSRASDILEKTELDKRVESGDPAKIIIQTAKAGNYDLIVMGSKGHSAVERYFLGSVSEHVIHYTDSSVLLVR